MNYLIILSSNYDDHFLEIEKRIAEYDHFFRVNKTSWLVNTKFNAGIIRQHLANTMGMHDSLLIFQLNNEFSIANELDVSDWLEDTQKNRALLAL